MFSLTVFAWIFFRAENIEHAFNYINHIFITNYLHNLGQIVLLPKQIFFHKLFSLILIMLITEWINRKENFGLSRIRKLKHKTIRWFLYVMIIGLIIWYNKGGQEFIYFQF